MTLIASWLRLELRRRWRSLAVLALLIAIASGTVMAAVAGARRGASALSRLQDRTLAATAAVYANDPNFDWQTIRALPEVEALGTFVVTYGEDLEGLPDGTVAFPPADDNEMRTIERPVVLAGRLPDPARSDEAVVTPLFAKNFHKDVGDAVVLLLPTPKQLIAGEATDHQLRGPRVRLHIVGVVRSPWLAADSPNGKGNLIPSAGVAAKYRANVVGIGSSAESVNAIVRLRGGEDAIAAFRRHVAAAVREPGIEIVNLPEQQRATQRATTFEARCLLAFGGAALVAALFLLGPAIVRYTSSAADELGTMRALGMTPQQAIVASAAGPTGAAVAGVIIGSAAAVVASRWFPIGSASLVEPSPGMSVDWTVLGLGVGCVLLAVPALAATAGWVSVGGAARRPTRTRRSSVAQAATRAGLPVPVVIGARFALEPGRGRANVPVRPALIGAVVGVLGILAAFTFAHAVSDAADKPERFGQTFQLVGYVGLNGADFGPADKLLGVLAKGAEVAALDDVKLGVATVPGGDTSITLYRNKPVGTGITTVVTSGRMPVTADEVVLAPRTAAALHVRRGDTLELIGDHGGPARLTVSGIGFVPEGPHNGYADGGWLTAAGYRRLFTGFQYHEVLVALHSGVAPAAGSVNLVRDVTTAFPGAAGFGFDFAYQPAQVEQIRQVRALPVLLGCFLALLAVGAVGHALATAVRRRSSDLAVLRALGMTPGQSRSVIITQATVHAVAGLAFGVPLGIALGRYVWRAVADYTPLQYVAPSATWALVLVAPTALIVANLLAALPGRRAARMPVSQILRAE
jgi:hypothetical protein